MQKLTGKCLCGSIEYSSDAEPIFSIICHCDDCQRQTGTAFSMTVGVPKASMKINNEDKLKEFIGESASGNKVRRKFCPDCGSPIISMIAMAPDMYMIKAGTLDDSSWVRIDSNFFTKSANNWNKPDESIKCFEGNPSIISGIKTILKSF